MYSVNHQPLNTVLPAAERRSYEFAPLTEFPDAALAQFSQRMYPERAAFLTAHWLWLYRIGEYDWAPLPLLAVAGQTVIGHIGTIPVLLQAGQAVRRAVWDVDLAVLPEYQRRKVGSRLMQTLR